MIFKFFDVNGEYDPRNLWLPAARQLYISIINPEGHEVLWYARKPGTNVAMLTPKRDDYELVNCSNILKARNVLLVNHEAGSVEIALRYFDLPVKGKYKLASRTWEGSELFTLQFIEYNF
ncbi:hypothetical protein [Pseudomonas aeruginosa]|uniref:hypothetical protein n=1 Tax=Pseudomonas aeruginosa TaxID=287 RepID=UPI001CA5ADC6|nr:hypothetical protein [Pseudomonas aeruginosa]MBW6069683.1 hypothetical protein [Pseudomonas aeruginosa]